MKDINVDECVLFLTSTNPDIYHDLKNTALKYFTEEGIIECELPARVTLNE